MPVASTRSRSLVAGLSVAGLLIPEAIAYAGIAGLAPEHALVASVAGLVAHACVGGIRYAIVSPTSSSAAILAAAVGALSVSTPGGLNALALSSALVLLAGVLFVLGAAAPIGHLATFISRPVLRGFAFGLAVTIVIKQLPHIVGIAVAGAGPVQILLHLVERIADWRPWTLAIAFTAYASLRLLKRIPMFQAAFAVILLSITAARVFDLQGHGVALVGRMDLTGMRLALPVLSRDEWLQTAELAFPLVVILYAESRGSIRTLALRHNDLVNPNRELAALGAANFLSGVLQGLPVDAGFSASSANEDAGARSKAAGLVAAIMIVVLLLAAAPWLALSESVLAAVVISALTHALDPRPLVALWRLGRDEILASSAALAVIVLGVVHGMMLAVLLSILAAVRRFSQARVSVLGELEGTRDYVDAARHPEAIVPARVLIVRPEQSLFFANTELALSQVRRLAEQRKEVSVLVLSLEESIDLDSTAVEAIAEFSAWVVLSKRRLLLARVKENVRELLQRTQAPDMAIPCFWSVADAVTAAHSILSELSAPIAASQRPSYKGS